MSSQCAGHFARLSLGLRGVIFHMAIRTTYIHEGDYALAIDVDEFDDPQPGSGWGPYLSYGDVLRLEKGQAALKNGDLDGARRYGRLFKMAAVPA